MSTRIKINRRDFLKLSAGAGAGLVIGFNLAGCDKKQSITATTDFAPNAWLRISADGGAIVMLAETEMGQGVMTALPMLVAEELEVDWAQIRVEKAELSAAYGYQSTGGSSSVRKAWLPLRTAGAIAREMLITAAAKTWAVAEGECRAENGTVVHVQSGRHLAYGDLTRLASTLPVPESVRLKEREEFSVIGRPRTRLDAPAKVKGEAIYGIDIKLPGMLTAVIAHCPTFGGKLAGFDDVKARKIAGVRHVVKVGDDAVAVVADHFWVAKKGLAALDVQWNKSADGALSSADIERRYVQALERPGEVLHETGETPSQQTAVKTVDATYFAPFQAHATMEPMGCVAHVRGNECDVWVSTQSPSEAKTVAAQTALSTPVLLMEKIKSKLSGRTPLENIRIHPTFVGGGFGRRLEQDFVAEAVQISKAIGKPVKLQWTREEDMQHDYYRPATYSRISADVGADGLPLAWRHRIVGPTKGSSTGGAEQLPYAIPKFGVEFVKETIPVPIGAWRSVGSSINAFAIESFIDELAATAGKDPYDYRLQLLKGKPRDRAVLQLAAEKAAWGHPKNGLHQGLAYHHCFGSRVAQIAEVSVDNGKIRVHRIICAIDCGMVVNPDIVASQMEGAIVFGLTAAIKGRITLQNGGVQQSNFHDFPLLRISEIPVVETFIVNSNEPPEGVGEPGVPPVAPAVANAVFAATGLRMRQLPIEIRA